MRPQAGIVNIQSKTHAMLRRFFNFLFGNWWLPVALAAAIIGYQYLAERYWSPPPYNPEFPFFAAMLICLSLILLMISVVYQLLHRRWLPALLSTAVVVWAVKYLFL